MFQNNKILPHTIKTVLQRHTTDPPLEILPIVIRP
jgi:hypothetical protein